jgi:hypothetical protein
MLAIQTFRPCFKHSESPVYRRSEGDHGIISGSHFPLSPTTQQPESLDQGLDEQETNTVVPHRSMTPAPCLPSLDHHLVECVTAALPAKRRVRP